MCRPDATARLGLLHLLAPPSTPGPKCTQRLLCAPCRQRQRYVAAEAAIALRWSQPASLLPEDRVAVQAALDAAHVDSTGEGNADDGSRGHLRFVTSATGPGGGSLPAAIRGGAVWMHNPMNGGTGTVEAPSHGHGDVGVRSPPPPPPQAAGAAELG
jgi:hypothetical protein